MASMRAEDLLAGYPVEEGVYDEGFSATGRVAPAARRRWRRSCAPGPCELPGASRGRLKRAGVRFSSVEGDLEFYVDPVRG